MRLPVGAQWQKSSLGFMYGWLTMGSYGIRVVMAASLTFQEKKDKERIGTYYIVGLHRQLHPCSGKI